MLLLFMGRITEISGHKQTAVSVSLEIQFPKLLINQTISLSLRSQASANPSRPRICEAQSQDVLLSTCFYSSPFQILGNVDTPSFSNWIRVFFSQLWTTILLTNQ